MALTLHGTVSDNTAVLDRRSAKPLIINGDMAVAQRGTSANREYWPCICIDRMLIDLNRIMDLDSTQDTDVPTGSRIC